MLDIALKSIPGIRKASGWINRITGPFEWLMKSIEVPENLEAITTLASDEETPPVSVGMTSKGVAEIWGAVEKLYRTGLYPAISFCLRRHGKIVLKRTIGYRKGGGPGEADAENKELIDPETPVCIFSCTKPVTAMLIHLLSERRELSLLDPISYYIPEFGQNGKNNITIYQLLCHKAGIPKLPDVRAEELEEIIFDNDEMVRRLCSAPADSPGHHSGYHPVTAGFIIGEIVRRVTSMNCREFLEENILQPLKFKYFNYGLKSEHVDKAAQNYFTGFPLFFPWTLYEKRIIGFKLKTVVQAANDHRMFDAIIPAGNIYASADECSRYFQMLLNGGELDGIRIFKPLTIRRAIVKSGKPQIDTTLLIPVHYSAGMMLGGQRFGLFGPQTQRAYGHIGTTNNLIWADPERDISVALLTTGKPLLGLHYLPLFRLLGNISRNCQPMSIADQDALEIKRGMKRLINSGLTKEPCAEPKRLEIEN